MWVDYVLAVVVVVGVLLIRRMLDPVLGDRVPFITVFAALMPLILLVRPAAFLLAALLGLAGVWFFFLPPRWSFMLEGGTEKLQAVAFTVAAAIATIAAWISARRHRSARRAQERLRRNAEAFYNLVHHSPFGVYIVDSQFRLVEVSAGSRKVFAGVEPLIGRDFAEILRIIWPEPFASEAIDLFRRTLTTGLPYHAPNTTEQRQNIDATESYDWKIERITLPDDQFGVVCHFYDATRLREVEQALRDADRRKDEFLATLAHELRNPLAPISHAVRYLAVAGPQSPDMVSAREVIDRQVTHMARLIDDLTEVSRITTGKLRLRRAPMDLRDCVRGALESCRTAYPEKNLHIRARLPEEPLPVEGDAVRLTQVIGNLLHNACKYTPEGGNIEVHARRTDSDVVVRVKDDGVGIAPEMLPQVYDMFVQGDQSLERSVGGLGIGLSLVKAIVEMHGGAVEAQSAGPGKGSEFIVHLPSADPAGVAGKDGAPQPQERASSQTAAPLRLLIVEDNTDAARTLAKLLRMGGHEVEVCHDGAAALEAGETFAPDAVLLDLGLPRMNGFDVCRAIRRAPWGREALVIAMTGWGAEEDRRKTQEAGFDEHLVKPVEYQQLMSLLETHAAPRLRTGEEKSLQPAG